MSRAFVHCTEMRAAQRAAVDLAFAADRDDGFSAEANEGAETRRGVGFAGLSDGGDAPDVHTAGGARQRQRKNASLATISVNGWWPA